MNGRNPEIRTSGGDYLTPREKARVQLGRRGYVGTASLVAAGLDWAIDREASTKRKVGQGLALAAMVAGLIYVVIGVATTTASSIVGGLLVASLGGVGLFVPRITERQRAADAARRDADFEAAARLRGHRD